MIKVIEKKTIFGEIKKTYQLTQGDSFRFRAYSRNVSNNNLISAITFKVSLDDYVRIFEKEYELQEDGSYILYVESTDTELWAPSTEYKTEIEVTYSDGSVDTIQKSELIVEPQIKEG